MSPQEFATKVLEPTFKELAVLTTIKGGEYAQDNDRLANFRDAGRRLGMLPEQVLLVYLDKHYAAITNYVKDQTTNVRRLRSEPIVGRLHDMLVYLILLKALWNERATANTLAAQDSPGDLVWDDDDLN